MTWGLSCQNCHARKVKCDLETPACRPCTKRGQTDSCIRNLPAPVQDLLDRIEALKGELQSERTSLAKSVPRSPAVAIEESRAGVAEDVLHRIGVVDGDAASSPASSQHANGPDRELQETVQAILPQLNNRQASVRGATQDAAVILEFLAWGRRKDQDLLPSSATGVTNAVAPAQQRQKHGVPQVLDHAIMSPQLDVLEMLYPESRQLEHLLNFHDRYLVWYHGAYNVRTFRADYAKFQTECDGSIRHPEVDYQWLALLFAIFTGGITCCTPTVARQLGYSESERQSLSMQWYNATIMCLNLGRYLEYHSLHAVQAIATLTISAHMIGMSNSQSILLSSANRISQSLGLHRLGVEKGLPDPSSPSEVARFVQRETGRRVWVQLCMQDWFNIPFSESCTITASQCTTGKPLNCNDGQTVPLPSDKPSITSYCNYHFDFATVIAEHQEAMSSCNTAYTRYEQVLLHDEKMRQLATASMPTFLSTRAQESPDWPEYVPWARRGLAICAAHKIIMIHRKFLNLSFISSAYSFTRRTCIAASKTILKEASSVADETGPVLWISHAFVVTAGIVLALDASHRQVTEPERAEQLKLLQDAIVFLQSYKLSTIAARGIKLLQILLRELNRPGQNTNSPKPQDSSKRRHRATDETEHRKRPRTTQPELATPASLIDEPTPVYAGCAAAQEVTHDEWNTFAEALPPDTGFGGAQLFDNLFNFNF